MKIKRRPLTRREIESATSRRPVVRKIRATLDRGASSFTHIVDTDDKQSTQTRGGRMKKRKNNTYIEGLRKKQAASRQAPQPKPVSEMSAQELAAEEQRLTQEIRHHREQAVEAGREAVSKTGSSGLNAFLASRRKARRAPWK